MVASFWGWDLKGIGGHSIFEVDAVAGPVRISVWGRLMYHFAVNGNGFPVDDGACDCKDFQVFEEDDIGAFARGDGAEILWAYMPRRILAMMSSGRVDS